MASFFSTLFSGGAEREAADRNRAALGRYTTDSLGSLSTGLNRSEDALHTGASSANAYQQQNYGLYDNLRQAGNAILDRGRANSLAALDAAQGYYEPLAGLGAKYGDATNLYLDSIGARGADGNTRAVNAFQAGPGYEFTLDQGIDALNRRRAASGMLNSGNADIDALKFGTGLANQTYGDWQNRLAGFVNPELTATSGVAAGRAGIAGRVADLAGADMLQRLGLEQAIAQGQAGANTARAANDVALGNTLAGLYTGDATNRVGVFGNNLSGQTAANNLQAQGESQGARNLMNAGLSLATLATGAMGGPLGTGMFGAGGAFGSGGAFNGLFGGGGPNLMSGGARDIFSGLTGGGYGGGGIGSR
jgi:hypothetical protein